MSFPAQHSPLHCDVIVVGGGAAGLATALRLASHRRVILLCKTPLGSGAATAWAQGGIAAAIGDDDSPALHVSDTELVGGGLNDHHIVEILAHDAGKRITELIALGASFDREPDGALALGREAAHSRRRILHAGGDATGREVLRALVQAIRSSSIRVIEAVAESLIVERGRVCGVRIQRSQPNSPLIEHIQIDSNAVVLATGGCGRLFQYTTNPPESTGDGLAMAARAGAELADLEFVQFHPTALAAGLDPMPLLTEALRGEGAQLIDGANCRLMEHRDARGDLAPRDIIARVIFEAVTSGKGAFLDARKIPDFAHHFPTVLAISVAAGLNPRLQPLPIAPAAHYHMGGIAVDEFGRSSLKGLWACGEAASTGVHGANRLASNSLLEAFVFGARVADDICAHTTRHPHKAHPLGPASTFGPPDPTTNPLQLAQLRRLMYEGVGLIRDEAGLRSALVGLEALEEQMNPTETSLELRNMVLIGRLVARAALNRCESRGSHFRRDFPSVDPAFAHRTHARATSYEKDLLH